MQIKNLPTLQELFNHNVFKVPDYQRGYSWENRHRTDLLEDLELIKDKNHYTGTIVIKNKGKKEGLGKVFQIYDVVDGQQRFTSLIILLNVIAEEMINLNHDNASEIADSILTTYIKEKVLMGLLFINWNLMKTIIPIFGKLLLKLKMVWKKRLNPINV
ncbi:DUF262 domain-containing protein [Methanobacterium sp.]|uniref:DUF262 domain-containing protein n=1 Tax=Methanobacterium sp. TaxID=2164 RepID=UPI00345BF401|nr:DUF262 domain-containing protein [Methanobacterium sp.]